MADKPTVWHLPKYVDKPRPQIQSEKRYETGDDQAIS